MDMHIKKVGEKQYQIDSSSSDKIYTIDLLKNTCDCPHYLFRLRKTGGDCKHLKAVKEKLSSSTADDFDKIINYIKESVFVDSIELIEKFGEDPINELISKGELIEEHGKIRLL